MAVDWLTDSEREALDEAIRLAETQPSEPPTPDTCQRCGGYRCDQCRPPLPDRSKARSR